MSESRWKVVYVPWWKKVPLLVTDKDGEHRQVGWVSRQRAYLVNNLSMGWVAFVDQQTPENIDHWFCPYCKAAIWGSHRSKLEKSMSTEAARSDGEVAGIVARGLS